MSRLVVLMAISHVADARRGGAGGTPTTGPTGGWIPAQVLKLMMLPPHIQMPASDLGTGIDRSREADRICRGAALSVPRLLLGRRS